MTINKVLEQIIEKKRGDLREERGAQDLECKTQNSDTELFYKGIMGARNNPAIIAEVKFASPSEGDMVFGGMTQEERLLRRVREYNEGGADAVSIITEKHFFKGDLSYVKEVKRAVSLPVLQKDFVIDEYQIYEAKAVGSDALLLIARIVEAGVLRSFVELCRELKIEPVVEINSEEDLEKGVGTEARFVAVNARDLDTFEVNVERACELMRKIPERFVRLGFSGVKSGDEVKQYRQAGARGVLVGTALMRAGNIGEFLGCIKY